ncbi:magnesium transporter NIPA-domain-containing protein [Amanita rubescens]|nr:magnesium transporter NIPA-domain-containing protein [Amanita rubescens]
MVDDKYIGLILSLAGSVAIGTSFIITKKGLNDAAERLSYGSQATDSLSFFRNPIWWAGMCTMVLGEIANFAAYAFAPPILITPLGALSVIIGAVLASFLLQEELGHLGRLGCALCLIGSLIIVLHAPEDKPIKTVDEILNFAVQPGFMLYCFTVLVFTLVMVYSVVPKYGRSNPVVYISICSLVGSVSVMAIKGFGVAIKLTIGGNNQLTHPSTYVFGIVVALCILVQMTYFNKALDTFSTNVVNPMYYVGFSSATAVASIILFQGFQTTNATDAVSLLCGFAVTFLGVHLLNLSRRNDEGRPGHSALDGGLLNPQLGISGRMSLEGWNGVAENASAAPPGRRGHSRGNSGSRYRSQSTTLFNAYEEGLEPTPAPDNMALHNLNEEDESEEEVDERTQLRKTPGPNDGYPQQINPNQNPQNSRHNNQQSQRQSVSRSHSSSPIPTPRTPRTMGGNVRIP